MHEWRMSETYVRKRLQAFVKKGVEHADLIEACYALGYF
jgi:hypothetical protein